MLLGLLGVGGRPKTWVLFRAGQTKKELPMVVLQREVRDINHVFSMDLSNIYEIDIVFGVRKITINQRA